MRLESLLLDVRYALRGIRRSPLFATSVAATIGLGLGVLCSAFTIVNAYVVTPVNLPDRRSHCPGCHCCGGLAAVNACRAY